VTQDGQSASHLQTVIAGELIGIAAFAKSPSTAVPSKWVVGLTNSRRSTPHRLAISNFGDRLSPDFNPANTSGLGMKVVVALARQLGGALEFRPQDDGCAQGFRSIFRAEETGHYMSERSGRYSPPYSPLMRSKGESAKK
jgi:hypothetical protein